MHFLRLQSFCQMSTVSTFSLIYLPKSESQKVFVQFADAIHGSPTVVLSVMINDACLLSLRESQLNVRICTFGANAPKFSGQ